MIKRASLLNFSVAALLTLTSPLAAQEADLDALFADLAEASAEEAPRIEGQIATIWSRSGSAAMDLLLRRGEDALEDGDHMAAIEHYTAIIDHAPQFAEGYNGRATAFYLMGRMGPALDDIRTTLELEPRHFGAMRGLGIMLEELDRPEDALEVFREILALHPHAEGVSDAAERLEIKLEGQSL